MEKEENKMQEKWMKGKIKGALIYGHFLGICENYVCGTKGLYALPEPIIPPSNIRFDMKCGR